MTFKIKVEKLKDGGKIGTPGSVVYADSADEAYKIYKGTLEMKGHAVLES